MVELFNSISKTLIKSELIIFISILNRTMIVLFELNYDKRLSVPYVEPQVKNRISKLSVICIRNCLLYIIICCVLFDVPSTK